MFCNDCLTEAKTQIRTENESEREKAQANIPNSTACLSLWFGFGAVKTEVSKFLHVFLAVAFQEKEHFWGAGMKEDPMSLQRGVHPPSLQRGIACH